jgi:hypothetical protein
LDPLVGSGAFKENPSVLDTLKELIGNQLQAALCTLHSCIDKCPEAAWDAPVANLAFCQVTLHTLFYADFYLGRNEHGFREQPFHRDNPQFFRDYEEMEDRKQVLLYDRVTMKAYLEHCRKKGAAVLAEETVETLSAPCGFTRREFSRVELYVYNIRHIQHHAAQLALRLRLDYQEDTPWFGSGWPAPP